MLQLRLSIATCRSVPETYSLRPEQRKLAAYFMPAQTCVQSIVTMHGAGQHPMTSFADSNTARTKASTCGHGNALAG